MPGTPLDRAISAGIDAYHDQIQRAGNAIRVPIDDWPYGMRDSNVEDASGNRLDFGEPIEDLDR